MCAIKLAILYRLTTVYLRRVVPLIELGRLNVLKEI